MADLGTAYVQIVPSTEGIEEGLTSSLTAAGSSAGQSAGNAFGSSFKTGAKALAGAAVTAGVVKSWKTVDAAMDTVAIKTGATGDALTELQDVVKAIATTMPVGFSAAADAVGEVNTRFGLTGKDLEKLSKQFVMFANINGTDVSKTVDSTSKVIAAFGLEAEDAADILDALNTVGQQTGVDVGTLADQVAANAAQFAEMGLSAADAANFLGQADLAGLESTTMLTGLKTAMKNAAGEGVTLSDELSGFVEVMNSNADESDKLAAAYETFGNRAGAAIYNAVSNGTLNLEGFTGSLTDFEGSVATTFETTQDPLDQFQTTLNNLAIIGSQVFETFMNVAGPALETLNGLLQQFNEWWNSLSPEMQNTISTVALVAGAFLLLSPVISRLGGLVSTVAGGISGLIGKLTGAGSAAASAAGPVASAGASFSQMAGQALQLIAAGAAVFLIAEAMNVLVQAAIQLADAGPAAIGVFVLLAATSVGVTAAIVAIGSAATISAVGLLALGAAIFLIEAGIALIVLAITGLINAFTGFSQQLPLIAEYGGTAALAIMELAGALVLFAGGAALAGAAGLLLAGGLLAAGGGAAVFGAAGLLAAVGALALAGGLALCLASVSGIANDAVTAANALGTMVTSVDIVKVGLQGLGDMAKSAVDAVISFFTGGAKEATGDAADFMNGVNSAFAAGFQKMIMTTQASIAVLQRMFSSTKFRFNQNIAVPHFSMTGAFDTQTGAVPTINTRWYASGGIFNRPAIFGAYGNTLLGAGEAGPEAVAPISELQKYMNGGTTYNLYIDGIKYNTDDYIDESIGNFVSSVIRKGSMYVGK